jgi:predicted sulfurtransferase
MDTTDAPRDTSDPISYTCTCPASSSGGQVLLFYRYWNNSPQLPAPHPSKTEDTEALALFHSSLASKLCLGGKFRIAREGFNITLGGTQSSISKYIEECCAHWSFTGLHLTTPEARDSYFKPTPGCGCAFGGKASVRVTTEITPLGITNYSPSSWSNVVSLSPAEFHALCEKGQIPLIDVRNHYESRIGYFVTGTGAVAVRPPVRRFSQWPGYVARHVLGNEIFNAKKGRAIATYCTGGIRCEKGARWMQEAFAKEGDGGNAEVYTLDGGIVAYQAWMSEEIKAGRKKPEESFFKGKNYVFDARGAIATDGGTGGKVAKCHGCGKAEDRLGKCQRIGCHLVLVVCEACEMGGGVACCEDCWGDDKLQQDEGSKWRSLCKCERDREKLLWGGGGAKIGHSKLKQNTRGRQIQ